MSFCLHLNNSRVVTVKHQGDPAQQCCCIYHKKSASPPHRDDSCLLKRTIYFSIFFPSLLMASWELLSPAACATDRAISSGTCHLSALTCLWILHCLFIFPFHSDPGFPFTCHYTYLIFSYPLYNLLNSHHRTLYREQHNHLVCTSYTRDSDFALCT